MDRLKAMKITVLTVIRTLIFVCGGLEQARKILRSKITMRMIQLKIARQELRSQQKMLIIV